MQTKQTILASLLVLSLIVASSSMHGVTFAQESASSSDETEGIVEEEAVDPDDTVIEPEPEEPSVEENPADTNESASTTEIEAGGEESVDNDAITTSENSEVGDDTSTTSNGNGMEDEEENPGLSEASSTEVTGASSTSALAEEVTGTSTPSSTSDTIENIVNEAENNEENDASEIDAAAETTEIESASSSAFLSASSTPEDERTASTTAEDSAVMPVIGTSTPSTTSIVSGDAVALANILNLVNTNIVNSNGVVLFKNFFEALTEALDLRVLYDSLVGAGCSLLNCDSQNTDVNIANNATIDNSVTLDASSGQNVITNADNALIQTGNAYAGLNLVNVANTNVVDSNYLLVTINAFDDVNGDVVFPSLSEFFSSLANGASGAEAIELVNDAAIENNVNVGASSGDNTISSTSEASGIASGDSHANTNVFNEINTSLVGDKSVSIVFRVHGSWVGDVFGAPPGLLWTVGNDGSIYLFDGGGATSTGNHMTSTSISGENSAAIQNDINVVALTGENAITNANNALIQTGNAYAGANIINVANANVVGRNWILAIINIFGDFNGNISFGRPDLWVGEQVKVPEKITNGSELSYELTVINNGDAPATNVVLADAYPSANMDILNSSAPHELDGSGRLTWKLGTIPPRAALVVTYTARLKNADEGAELENTASVALRETDNNLADNTDVVGIKTYEHRGNGVRISLSEQNSGDEIDEADLASLTVFRATPTSTVSVGKGMTRQSLMIRNSSDTIARGVIVHDILRNTDGIVIQDEVWELGDVLPKEEILLGYNIAFKGGARPGLYSFATRLEGVNLESSPGDINGRLVVLAEEAEGAVLAEEHGIGPTLRDRLRRPIDHDPVAFTVRELDTESESDEGRLESAVETTTTQTSTALTNLNSRDREGPGFFKDIFPIAEAAGNELVSAVYTTALESRPLWPLAFMLLLLYGFLTVRRRGNTF